jgi:hypothetical protein
MKIKKLIIIVLAAATATSTAITANIDNSSVWGNVFIGLTSSLLVVLLLEIVNAIYSRYAFSKLEGTYKRIKITEVTKDTQPNGIYNDLTEGYNINNVDSEITLKYNGEGEYTGEANYLEGAVSFNINIDINTKTRKIQTLGYTQYK